MGFPAYYTELTLPKLLVHMLTITVYIRKFIFALATVLGLASFLEPEMPFPTRPESCSDLASVLVRELLPVVKFSDMVDPPESCAVCLYEFDIDDEIRQLVNCRHIFHRSCLDRWMDHDRRTCPLCRTSFVSEEMQEVFNERLWLATGIFDFYYH